MVRYIAVHPLAFTEEQLRPLAGEPLPQGVTWHSTHSAFAEGKSFCHWEAPGRETILEILQRYSIPYEAVHEVRRFDPALGEMEPSPIEVEVPQHARRPGSTRPRPAGRRPARAPAGSCQMHAR